MNIRKTIRGHCRECEEEVWKSYFERRRQNIRVETELINEYKAKAVERHKANKNDLFALEATTASGWKVEVICRKHLGELPETIARALNGINAGTETYDN